MQEIIIDTLANTVTMDKEIYDEMVSDINFLRALEGAGVDNWDGYEYAQEMLDE